MKLFEISDGFSDADSPVRDRFLFATFFLRRVQPKPLYSLIIIIRIIIIRIIRIIIIAIIRIIIIMAEMAVV